MKEKKRSIFSVCGMCTSRCPILVHLKNKKDTEGIHWIQGNPHASLRGALCARGSASIALLNDDERPQEPLIRVGKRGEGKWRTVTWDEAFDYIAEKIQSITEKYGSKSILFSDRGGPFSQLTQAFVRGLGSPNYCNHDSACSCNAEHASTSITGLETSNFVLDYSSCKHIVLQTRNLFEGLIVTEVNTVLDSLANGCKLTVIDVRGSVTASKADTFLLIKPATDYAFNLAIIHELITKKLYNSSYVENWTTGFEELCSFIRPYTPEWAEKETGIPAESITKLSHELADAAPSVIWHPTWMSARYTDSFYVSRTTSIINTLLGAFGAKGGLPIASSPKDVGRKGLTPFTNLFPRPDIKRADGAGWRLPHITAGGGLVHYAYDAIENDDPYPIRAYICHRHDPLMAFPDPDALKHKWEKLELLVSTSFSWSDTAWHSDVVLPMSTFLERDSILATRMGLKPYFFMRRKAVEPRYNTKADWEILSGLAKRLSINELTFETIEELWKYQLEGTGVTIEDFTAKGFVELVDTPHFIDMETFVYPTPSGKIEFISAKLEKNGIPSLKTYETPKAPPEGSFRVISGRCAVHTQGHTVNNTLLSQFISENCLWIHADRARALDICSGDDVCVYSQTNKTKPVGIIKAFVTEAIHPDAVFLLHGFGHELPVESRAYHKGVASNKLIKDGLNLTDKAGGGVAMQEHFVTLRKA